MPPVRPTNARKCATRAATRPPPQRRPLTSARASAWRVTSRPRRRRWWRRRRRRCATPAHGGGGGGGGGVRPCAAPAATAAAAGGGGANARGAALAAAAATARAEARELRTAAATAAAEVGEAKLRRAREVEENAAALAAAAEEAIKLELLSEHLLGSQTVADEAARFALLALEQAVEAAADACGDAALALLRKAADYFASSQESQNIRLQGLQRRVLRRALEGEPGRRPRVLRAEPFDLDDAAADWRARQVALTFVGTEEAGSYEARWLLAVAADARDGGVPLPHALRAKPAVALCDALLDALLPLSEAEIRADWLDGQLASDDPVLADVEEGTPGREREYSI